MKDWNGNGKSIYKTLGASNHTDKERAGNDFYATDPIAIDKLLTVESPHQFVWECACGNGHLAQRLKEKGFNVMSTDIIQREYELSFVDDFLNEDATQGTINKDIITNPPYKFAKEFVLKALSLVDEGRKYICF